MSAGLLALFALLFLLAFLITVLRHGDILTVLLPEWHGQGKQDGGNSA